jgi:hypothetical protein
VVAERPNGAFFLIVLTCPVSFTPGSQLAGLEVAVPGSRGINASLCLPVYTDVDSSSVLVLSRNSQTTGDGAVTATPNAIARRTCIDSADGAVTSRLSR